ncbi:hypothetical protein RB595_004443 [Gaeumannomyces hyphopodioides]
MAEDGPQPPSGLDDSAIFETYHQADDVLYIGSDDEHYETPSQRLQRCREHYNAFNQKGWRVPPVLVTSRLKGPFSSDVWENPWRSRSTVPAKIGRKGKTATTVRVTKPLQNASPTTSKALAAPGSGSILGLMPDTATNIIKPKMVAKSTAHRPVPPAQESTSELGFAGSVFAAGSELASRRNPRKRGGSSTDWLRRVSTPKRPRSGSREEPLASSPTDKLIHKRSIDPPSEPPSLSGSGSNQARNEAPPPEPLHGMLESCVFPGEESFIEDSFVIDEDSIAHTPIHPSRFQPENRKPMHTTMSPPTQNDMATPTADGHFLRALSAGHRSSTTETSSATNASAVGGTKDIAQARVPSSDHGLETQQDDSFCYRTKAKSLNAWTRSGIHHNVETRDEEHQKEQVSAPSLKMADQSNTEQPTQDSNADESSWAGFASDSESPAVTNPATSLATDMEITAAAGPEGSVDGQVEDDTVPTLFSAVKADILALSPAKAHISQSIIKQTSPTGDETLIPEHGCTTTFGSEETTLVAGANTDHVPPLFSELKEPGADSRSEEPVAIVRVYNRHPASAQSASTSTPPQAIQETVVHLLPISTDHSHQSSSEGPRLPSQMPPEENSIIQAMFAVSGIETGEVTTLGPESPALPLPRRAHPSAAGAAGEGDARDGKLEYDDSHRASYPPDTGAYMSPDTSHACARLATQDQSPWAAPHTVRLHATFPSSPIIKPLAEPAPVNSPRVHSVHLATADIDGMTHLGEQATPVPTVQSPWAQVNLRVPHVPVDGAASPLSLSFDPREEEVPNPVLPRLDNIGSDKDNVRHNGRPSTPQDKLSSLPTPDLSASNKPFRQFLSPSPRSKRRYGGFGNTKIITVDGLPQVAPGMIGEVIANPWAQHNRPAKRVRFAPLPGEKVGDGQDPVRDGSHCSSPLSDPPSSSDMEGDGDEDYIEAGLPEQKSQSVARAKKVAALATAAPARPQLAPARPCSPPPSSRTSVEDLPSEVTLFRKHFAKMQGKQHHLTLRQAFIRLPMYKDDVSPSSQAADAAAERFVDADHRRDDTAGVVPGGGSSASGGILKLQSALKPPAMSHDDGMDDVSAVINNLGDFLGSWDLDSELAKATAEKERERDSESRLNPFSISMDIGQWS